VSARHHTVIILAIPIIALADEMPGLADRGMMIHGKILLITAGPLRRDPFSVFAVLIPSQRSVTAVRNAGLDTGTGAFWCNLTCKSASPDSGKIACCLTLPILQSHKCFECTGICFACKQVLAAVTVCGYWHRYSPHSHYCRGYFRPLPWCGANFSLPEASEQSRP
jgi:hypothetical protein